MACGGGCGGSGSTQSAKKRNQTLLNQFANQNSRAVVFNPKAQVGTRSLKGSGTQSSKARANLFSGKGSGGKSNANPFK